MAAKASFPFYSASSFSGRSGRDGTLGPCSGYATKRVCFPLIFRKGPTPGSHEKSKPGLAGISTSSFDLKSKTEMAKPIQYINGKLFSAEPTYHILPSFLGGDKECKRNMVTKIRLFSGTANPSLSQEIAHYMGLDLGKINIKRFANPQTTLFGDLLASNHSQVESFRIGQHGKFSVPTRPSKLWAKSSTTCWRTFQSWLPIDFVKLTAYQEYPSNYLLKGWGFGCSYGSLTGGGDRCVWKNSNLGRRQLHYNARTFTMSTLSSGSDLDLSIPSLGARGIDGATRVSHAARLEAQEALMDYLYCTRGMLYTDAEHISKHSPNFIKFLLTKVENGEAVCWGIKKFFRYNPINEFDPFFESLGLKQSEIKALLPQDLFFLSDDPVLLENYHVLCNYGVPRSKIGKIYKEAYGVFRYDYGVLISSLQSYEGLGLESSTVIKLISSCPRLLVGGIDTVFVQVLKKLKDLGFGQYWMRACLSENYTYQWDKMLQLMNFLHEIGCKKDDMKKLIRGHPWFLFDESGKKIYILVSVLLKLGLKMNVILSLLLQHPHIVSQSFLKNLYLTINFLSEIGMEPADIARIVCAHPQSMIYLLNKKPADVLSRLNIDKQTLCAIIMDDPNQLSDLASKRKVRTMLPSRDRTNLLEKTTFLLKLGYSENSDEMVAAHKQFRGRGDQLQQRFNVLLDAGLEFHDASLLVREAPQILGQSVDVLQKKIDYLVNFAGYPLRSIMDFPTYLCYNIDRIKLRFSMFQLMKEKGVVKGTTAPSSIIASSEGRFEKYYVNVLPEGPQLWQKFKNNVQNS